MSDLVCFCYGYSKEDIVNDVVNNKGKSLILETITDARKKGICECDYKHPEKR